MLVVHGEGAHSARLAPHELAERSRPALLLRQRTRDDDLGSFWLCGGDDVDEGLLAVEALRLAVRDWDLEHIVGPALLALGDERTILLCDGHPGLPEFSLRQTLQWGVTREVWSQAALERAVVVPVWSGSGADTLQQRALAGALPSVHPDRLTIAIAAPPGGPEAILSALLARARQPEAAATKLRTLLAEPNGSPQGRLASAALRRWEWTEAVVTDLRHRCAALGVRLVEAVSLRDLVALFEAPQPDACLVLIAHQDSGNLHLGSGPVAIEAFAALLGDLRARRRLPWGSVDLGVCGAAEFMNLADIFQSYGVPVVMTSGTWAYFARLVGCWLSALDLLAVYGEAPSLPELLDAAWALSQDVDNPIRNLQDR